MQSLARMDLFHLTGALIRTFLVQHHPDPYLQFFLDHMLALLNNDKQSLSDALSWWEDKGKDQSVTTPEGLDAIRVMTIHKAKGLEFPVVIYPFVDDGLSPTLDNLWVDIKDEILKEQLPFSYISTKQSLGRSDLKEVYDDEMSQSTVDLVNIFYVALTRAREELYVICNSPPAKIDELNSLPKILRNYLHEEAEWQVGKMAYTFGVAIDKKDVVDKADLSARSAVPVSAGFTNWKKLVLLKRTVPEYWDVEDPERSFAYGNSLHYILSKIKYADEVQRSVDECLAEGVLEKGDYQQVLTMIRTLVTQSRFSWLFEPSWKINNEAELIDQNGVVSRPDRVMLKGNTAIVVDYKTGKRSARHKDQVKKYKDLLTEMGWQVSKALVLYLGKDVSDFEEVEVA
jgi:ATP-dependent exoDNAse (exonuclease V) beta subunit